MKLDWNDGRFGSDAKGAKANTEYIIQIDGRRFFLEVDGVTIFESHKLESCKLAAQQFEDK